MASSPNAGGEPSCMNCLWHRTRLGSPQVADISVFKFPNESANPLTSPASSQGAICRICHEGDVKEDLVAPCRCSGTMALVHLSCIETWLSSANIEACEICKHVFITCKKRRPYYEWLKDPTNPSDLHHLMGDLFCFVLLTPLAAVSSYLCVVGARHYALWSKRWEASGLFSLAIFLATLYVLWCSVTVRYHLKVINDWSQTHQKVSLVQMKRAPSSVYMMQTLRSDSNNNSGAERCHGNRILSPSSLSLHRLTPLTSLRLRDMAIPMQHQSSAARSNSSDSENASSTNVLVHSILQTNLPETVV